MDETRKSLKTKVEIEYADRSVEVFTSRRLNFAAYASLVGTGCGMKRVVSVREVLDR